MKVISIDGRLGRDAEVKKTSGGTPYVKFTMANTYYEYGENKTEWFDITSYDPFVIEKQIKCLKKGSYIIVNGSLKTEVKVGNGKVYLNQYVTAHNIDVPQIGSKKDSGNELVPSDTKPEETLHTEEPKAPNKEPIEYKANLDDPNNWDGEDDLPF